MSTIWIPPRRALVGVVTAAALAALAISSIASMSAASTAPAREGTITPKAFAFHDGMRALWEAHGTWTERAIVDFVGGLPDTQLVIGRLLQNQTDIGNAVKPYYGAKAGNELTALLKGHINAAVALLEAAKSGDASATAKAKAAFYANGNQVARFLHAANPRHWSLGAMQTMMRIHLDQVVGAGGRPARGALRRRDQPLQRLHRPHPRHGRHAQHRNHAAVPRSRSTR